MAKTGLDVGKGESFFSKELATEFQSYLRDQFGEIVTLSEAQRIGYLVAQFVFIKEARCKHDFNY